MFLCVFQVVLIFFPFISSIYFLCGWFVSWPLCFSDEGRSAVDLAGGAQIVAELIKSLYQNTEPENEKLLTVLCGMLMNYSNDNGNDPPPPSPKKLTTLRELVKAFWFLYTDNLCFSVLALCLSWFLTMLLVSFQLHH